MGRGWWECMERERRELERKGKGCRNRQRGREGSVTKLIISKSIWYILLYMIKSMSDNVYHSNNYM
jgi:hypothetical protein